MAAGPIGQQPYRNAGDIVAGVFCMQSQSILADFAYRPARLGSVPREPDYDKVKRMSRKKL
jgi:hypothetical protein